MNFTLDLFDPLTCQRPPLRWHGGEWRLAAWIIPHFGAHQNYVEVFSGAASAHGRRGVVPRTERLWMNFESEPEALAA